MKQFNLEEYLANPSRKMVTRDGRNARIICTDRKDSDAPIVALVGFRSAEGEICFYYTKEGKIYTDDSLVSSADLFFANDHLPEFKPYDRVLTRGHNGLPWKANLFSNFKIQGNNTIAVCLKGDYLLGDIIPFDENKVGKTEWEE